ncbi:nucleoside-diphosphate-sugar epimerase [Enterococcus sp. PF1-24]|uniref:SDR family oxidoreductase n=1 Tax=unclassified Enterococcus TaxID=2608891 RepID=UPI002476652C|nr:MULTISPECIES: aldehyde reductase [unclassified Enterococcus]MDH6363050.1 nucleoside-diphosphate-sugar epimerase [Enterococcus sp. PFB1-1]MDH6400144.1 nucleoside-diphosphate-sugar epimerase [Enterococcus sp. PF1-24]
MKNKVLVTGGTGFLGLQIIFQLLQQGYQVRTTLRSIASKDKIIETLQTNGLTNLEQLSFIETDLSKNAHWPAAMADCEYVLSVASPVFFTIPENEEDALRPAVDGITRILKAAKTAGVKRVVMTSNFGAVSFSKKNARIATTEDDWTNPEEKGLSIYEKSKLLAEKTAWDFIKTEGGALEFTTINPVAIFGSPLSNHISGSFNLLKNLFANPAKAYPNLPLNIVDVKDVADLHIRAMISPQAKGQRFIATADGQISMLEIANLIKEQRPELADKVSTKTLSSTLIRITALFNQQAKEGALFLNMSRNVSNEKAKKLLNWQPTTNEEIVLKSIDSMVKYGIIK